MNTDIVILEVLQWSFSLGGEHYTGKITGYVKADDWCSTEVKHPLSRREAIKLNKKDASHGSSRVKQGYMSDRFETRQELETAAVTIYKKEFPKAKALLVGGFAVADAQRCLDGPKWFKDAVNKIVAEQDECGGYDRNRKTMDRLYARYQKLTKRLAGKSV